MLLDEEIFLQQFAALLVLVIHTKIVNRCSHIIFNELMNFWPLLVLWMKTLKMFGNMGMPYMVWFTSLVQQVNEFAL